VIAEVIYGIDINAVEDESSISENGPLKHWIKWFSINYQFSE
jgi:hypothetical protein